MRNVMRNWMLGTALVAGLLGTGAVAANAAPQEFRGRPEQRFDRGRGFDRGYGRGFERPVVRGYGYGQPGYGVVVGGGYGGYIPPYPGDGYVWLNGGWVFRGRPEVAGFGYGRNERFDRGFDHGFDRSRGLDRGSGRGVDRDVHGRR